MEQRTIGRSQRSLSPDVEAFDMSESTPLRAMVSTREKSGKRQLGCLGALKASGDDRNG